MILESPHDNQVLNKFLVVEITHLNLYLDVCLIKGKSCKTRKQCLFGSYAFLVSAGTTWDMEELSCWTRLIWAVINFSISVLIFWRTSSKSFRNIWKFWIITPVSTHVHDTLHLKLLTIFNASLSHHALLRTCSMQWAWYWWFTMLSCFAVAVDSQSRLNVLVRPGLLHWSLLQTASCFLPLLLKISS